MDSQMSMEIMVGMLIALSLALFISAYVSSESAILARNERIMASIANSVNYDLGCALRSFGAGGS
jgi:hypothetical protein